MKPSPPGVALVLVRNAVSHDARVLRAATTMQALGFTVLVCGVVSASERQTRVEIGGIQIVRLDPGAGIRSIVGRRGRSGRSSNGDAVEVARMGTGGAGRSQPDAGAPRTPGANGEGVRSGGLARLTQRLKRQAVTVAFYLQGVSLAWRTSPALVHANDYNTMWIGVAAKLLRGSRLIYDSHELWADRNGRPEWRPWLVACEALFVRLSDATITASPGYAMAIGSRYRVPAPIVIRNIPVAGQSSGASPRARDSGLAVYLGGLMPGRGLEQAIEALALTPQLRLRLIGPGRDSYRAALQRQIDAAGVNDRVQICPAVPPAEILTAIGDADMGLMLIQPVCRSYELTLPNKLFEYAAAGLPILCSNLPVIGPLVTSEGLGEVVPADDIELIADGLRRLADPDVNATRRQRVNAFAKRVTWDQERAILADVYRRVSEREPGAEAERGRVTRVYEGYGTSRRKRRGWNAENPGNAAIRAELVDAAFAVAGPELAAAEDILDVGCGSGWWLERLDGEDRVSARLHGLELLPARAVAARGRVPGAAIRVGDARGLPFETRSFDVVTMFTVLSSLSSIAAAEATLSEARRVLRPGGVMLVWEPRLPTPLNRHTLRIKDHLLRGTLTGARVQACTITVMPPLARRLGARTERLYPRLAQVPALRTHRLTCARIP